MVFEKGGQIMEKYNVIQKDCDFLNSLNVWDISKVHRAMEWRVKSLEIGLRSYCL